MTRLLIAISFLLVTLLPADARAQVTPVVGTGCGGNATTFVEGSPRPGNRVLVSNPFPCLFMSAVTTVGLPVSIPWIGCGSRPCVLAVQPVTGTVGGITNATIILIPNDPTLIGACLRAQSGCFNPNCVVLDTAVDICVY